MLTCSLILLPILAALLFFVVPEASAKRVAFIASLAEFAVAIVAYITYKGDPSSASLSCKMPWISAMNANWHVAIDGISMLMVLLTTLLVPFILLSSFAKNFANPKAFYTLVLTMQAALIGVFTAMDGLFFYVFW
jgi:NADH-quinone oxidoreductase subunit M